MAAGDIVSCTVLSTGWEAQVVIEGLSDGGTYLMDGSGATLTNPSTAKVTFTVVSEGYTAAGDPTTKTRTVYGSGPRMKAYTAGGAHLTADETESGGNLTVTLSLSDPIYDDDNTGTGKSGTAPVVNISAGFYTEASGDGGTANNASGASFAVTNNSTRDYPKAIARWAVVPYQRVTTTLDLEVVAFHAHAESGKPVACVIFSTDDGNPESAGHTITGMSKSSAEDSLPCYKRTLTASAYSANTVVTCNFKAYPWIGDADSVLDSSAGGGGNDVGPLPLYMDKEADAPVYYAVVNTSTGVDGSAVASTTYATAAASPCLTIRRALALIHAANSNSADFCEILLQSNNHAWGDGTGTGTTTNGWVTITRDYKAGTPVTKANAKITGTSSNAVASAHVRLYDLTTVPSSYLFPGAAGRSIWFDHVDTICPTQVTTYQSYSYDTFYVTHCTAEKINEPWCAGVGVGNLVRGSEATYVEKVGSSGYGARCLLTTTLNHNDTIANGLFWNVGASNTICAYSQNLGNINGSAEMGYVSTVTGDVAIVCNVIERDVVGGLWELWASQSDSATDVYNVLIWHNTTAGGRSNTGYNWDVVAVRAGFSIRNNAFHRICLKGDVESQDGTCINARSLYYGVGWRGNHSEDASTTEFLPLYGGLRWTYADSPDFIDDNSYTGSGDGGGNYHTQAGSPLRGKLVEAADLVIPWDIEGTAYAVGGDAGAYTTAQGGRFWSYS